MRNDIAVDFPRETPRSTFRGNSENGQEVMYRGQFYDIYFDLDWEKNLSIRGGVRIEKLVERKNPRFWQSRWRREWTLRTEGFPVIYLYGTGKSAKNFVHDVMSVALSKNIVIDEGLILAVFEEPVHFLETLHRNMSATIKSGVKEASAASKK